MGEGCRSKETLEQVICFSLTQQSMLEVSGGNCGMKGSGTRAPSIFLFCILNTGLPLWDPRELLQLLPARLHSGQRAEGEARAEVVLLAFKGTAQRLRTSLLLT